MLNIVRLKKFDTNTMECLTGSAGGLRYTARMLYIHSRVNHERVRDPVRSTQSQRAMIGSIQNRMDRLQKNCELTERPAAEALARGQKNVLELN